MFDDWSEAGDLAPYGVDVREDADHVYVEADLPGFRKEDIDITLQDGVITIAAEHRERTKKEPQQKGDYLLRERRYERFERSFTLPQSVDEQSVNAKLDNGCLTITLDRTEQSKAKKIPLA
jgi:HSP20 family protein